MEDKTPLEEYRKEIEKLSLSDTIKEIAKIKAQLEKYKAIKVSYQKKFNLLAEAILVNKMEDEDISNMTVEGVGRVNLTTQIYASIKAANRAEAYQWLKDNGHGDVIINTVNASTLKALVKELTMNGEEISDLITHTIVTKAAFTRVKQ